MQTTPVQTYRETLLSSSSSGRYSSYFCTLWAFSAKVRTTRTTSQLHGSITPQWSMIFLFQRALLAAAHRHHGPLLVLTGAQMLEK